MSIRALKWAADTLDAYDLPRLERFALYVLAHFHNQTTNECFPSYETLGRRMGCRRESAIKAVKGLQMAGLVRIVPRRLGNRQGSNQYALFGSPSEKLRVNPASLSKRVSG